MKPFFLRGTLTSTDGATTESDELSLPSGGRVLYVEVGPRTSGQGPVRVQFGVFPSGRRLGQTVLVRGWMRGPGSAIGSGNLSRVVDFPLIRDAIAVLSIRNDTGSDFRADFVVAGLE